MHSLQAGQQKPRSISSDIQLRFSQYKVQIQDCYFIYKVPFPPPPPLPVLQAFRDCVGTDPCRQFEEEHVNSLLTLRVAIADKYGVDLGLIGDQFTRQGEGGW